MQSIRGVLTKYTDRQPEMPPGKQAGSAHAADLSAVHRDFDEVAARAPRQVLAQALAAGFRADTDRTLGQKTALLFHFSTPAERAEVLNLLLAIRPVTATDELMRLLSGTREVGAREAAEVQPDTVARLVDQAALSEPGVLERLARFYAGRPGLVKNLGIEFLIAAIRKVGEGLVGFRTAG